MAFTFTNYAGIRPQQSPMHDILGQILGGYTDMTKARYLQPGLEEELKKAQLYNQYYAPNMESQIGLRGTQAGQARAHTGLLGEQTRGEHFKNQYLPQTLQSELESKQLAATQAQMFNDMLKRKIAQQQGMGGGNMPQQMPNYSPGQGTAPFAEQPTDIQQQSVQPEMAQHIKQQLSQAQQPQENLMEPSIEDFFNKKMYGIDTFTPRYKAEMASRQKEKDAFNAEIGKGNAKYYDDSVKSYEALGKQDVALEQLQNAVENNPQFRNVVGPVKSFLTTWAGSAEQKKLLGDLQTSSGEIVLQVAPSLKGSWTGRDQKLVDYIKASPNDPADVFIGKLAAQRKIGAVLKDRAKIQAELISRGVPRHIASETAAKRTPLNKYESEIKELTKHKENNSSITLNDALAEYQRRKQAGLIQ